MGRVFLAGHRRKSGGAMKGQMHKLQQKIKFRLNVWKKILCNESSQRLAQAFQGGWSPSLETFNWSGPEHPIITLKLALLWGRCSPEGPFIPNYSVIVAVQRDRHLRSSLRWEATVLNSLLWKKRKWSALDSAQAKHAWPGVAGEEGWWQLCSIWALHR